MIMYAMLAAMSDFRGVAGGGDDGVAGVECGPGPVDAHTAARSADEPDGVAHALMPFTTDA
ncbi:hypothetical protein ACFDTO_07640 [Microbacteriaceae bacterium 4G12]